MIFNLEKFQKIKFNKGMTYVELIVVLSIFAIMSGVSLVNYRDFQARVDIKNLANDIALQIVGAQKNAMAGKLVNLPLFFSDKPAYGVYFESNQPEFVSFVDLGNSVGYDNLGFDSVDCNGISECLDKIKVNKNFDIKDLFVVGGNCSYDSSRLSIVFKRPDPSAIVVSDGVLCSSFNKVVINISSNNSNAGSEIDIYPSGRIQIK